MSFWRNCFITYLAIKKQFKWTVYFRAKRFHISLGNYIFLSVNFPFCGFGQSVSLCLNLSWQIPVNWIGSRTSNRLCPSIFCRSQSSLKMLFKLKIFALVLAVVISELNQVLNIASREYTNDVLQVICIGRSGFQEWKMAAYYALALNNIY